MTGTQNIDRGLLITQAFGPFVGQKVLNLQLSHGILHSANGSGPVREESNIKFIKGR